MNSEIEQKNIRFFNFWARFYGGKGPVSWWLKRLQKRVAEELKIPQKYRVLDVGCGPGDFLQILANKGLKKLAGIDLSSEMLKKAKQNLRKKATFRLASVEKLPFATNTFDFVVTTEAFHHFPSPKKAIKEMHRVLKKDGLLCIADINFYSGFVHWLFKKLEPGHVSIYSAAQFAKMFKKAGLKVIKQKRIGWWVILTIGRKL